MGRAEKEKASGILGRLFPGGQNAEMADDRAGAFCHQYLLPAPGESCPESGFDTGLLTGNFEWMAAFTLVLLALFFAPFMYIRSGVSTLPDFLERTVQPGLPRLA